jgi:hypothetical protein
MWQKHSTLIVNMPKHETKYFCFHSKLKIDVIIHTYKIHMVHILDHIMLCYMMISNLFDVFHVNVFILPSTHAPLN